MRRNNKKIISWLLMAVAILTINLSFPQSAMAIIQQQQEAPEQLLYSSRHKLRDNQGNTWQVILFKRVKSGRTEESNLRLVGFPEQFEFVHPGNLRILVNDEEGFSASDRFTEKSPSPNVGEFEVQEIVSNLPIDRSVKFVLPLTAENPVEIVLPDPVILEWQELAKS